MSSLFKKTIGVNGETETTVGALFKQYSCAEQRQFILECLEEMQEQHDVDCADAIYEVGNILIVREFELNVQARVSLTVTVMAPDEDAARDMIESESVMDLINESSDMTQSITIDDYDLEIDDVTDIS